jgi:hypothetical protein
VHCYPLYVRPDVGEKFVRGEQFFIRLVLLCGVLVSGVAMCS